MSYPDFVKEVYKMLQEREIHPSGTFDSGGRFYAYHDDLIDVRAPSRAWPHSHMIACRTLKYVKKVYDKLKIETKEELIKNI
jgi:hypothetical protein